MAAMPDLIVKMRISPWERILLVCAGLVAGYLGNSGIDLYREASRPSAAIRPLFGSVAKEAGSDAAATIAQALDRLTAKVDDSEIVIQVRRKQ